jgi:hypothetical protein
METRNPNDRRRKPPIEAASELNDRLDRDERCLKHHPNCFCLFEAAAVDEAIRGLSEMQRMDDLSRGQRFSVVGVLDEMLSRGRWIQWWSVIPKGESEKFGEVGTARQVEKDRKRGSEAI